MERIPSLIAIVGFIFFVRYIIRHLKNQKWTARLFVIFKNEQTYRDLENNERFKKLGTWEKRGGLSFIFVGSVNDDKLSEIIIDEYGLLKEDFTIYNPSSYRFASSFIR